MLLSLCPAHSDADRTRDAGGKRWTVVTLPGGGGRLLLARADDNQQRAAIGRQAAGRLAFFLETQKFARDHAASSAGGVRFTEVPRREDHGTVAVFKDLYGDLWDGIERRS